jgi:predicted DNA-binding protein (MmcQ/YjbR family)
VRQRAGKAPARNTINQAWHRAHRMPARATAAQRLKWHRVHAQACGCRPMPASLRKQAAATATAKARRPATAESKKTRSPRAARVSLKRARTGSSGTANLLARLRGICLRLPDTTEVEAWGHPTFRVAGKIFVGFGGTDEGGASMSVKTTHEMQAALVSAEPRFTIAAYVGKHGWISMAMPAGAKVDWNEVEVLVRGSYRLVAPAKLAAALPAP